MTTAAAEWPAEPADEGEEPAAEEQPERDPPGWEAGFAPNH
jgi:hypothetical protein